jgi:hypothetical protein
MLRAVVVLTLFARDLTRDAAFGWQIWIWAAVK